MTRSLPGTVEVEGREFLYVESSSDQGFARLLDEVLSACPTVPLPKSGGVIEEKARLIVPDKTSFLAISYKGDLQGWKSKIVCYCQMERRKWGVVRNGVFVASDGKEVGLTDCEVQFQH